jgi:cytochrome c-type biogenesis protein CcmH
MLIFAFAIAVLTGSSAAYAVQPDEIMADPVKEARARVLSQELRCMVCQNQSIDDSEAPLARDLRLLVRERIAAGDSDAQVIDFLVARYGEFVLLKPRLERSKSALGEATVTLTPDEEARLAALIADEPPPEKPA